MSHVVNIATVINDLDALESACKVLGFTLNRGKQTYKWFGHWVDDSPVPTMIGTPDEVAWLRSLSREQRKIEMDKRLGTCEHEIVVPGAGYTVGVRRNPNGPGYVLIYDWYQQHTLMQKLGGKAGEALVQRYAAERAKNVARSKGYRVLGERTLPNGEIKLVVGAH